MEANFAARAPHLWEKVDDNKTMMPILALAASLLAVGCPAYAFDLNGAWATDAAVCDKVFVKKDNKVSFAPNSAEYGGGFIVEGNRLHGQSQSCNIKSRSRSDRVKDDPSSIHVLAACATDIMMGTFSSAPRSSTTTPSCAIFPGCRTISPCASHAARSNRRPLRRSVSSRGPRLRGCSCPTGPL